MTRVEVTSYPVSIFIAGSEWEARQICYDYCEEVGLCVTVSKTVFVYTGGQEVGVIVGLINYPRFPTWPADILAKAEQLARRLIDKLHQQSATIQAPDRTVWISFRGEAA